MLKKVAQPVLVVLIPLLANPTRKRRVMEQIFVRKRLPPDLQRELIFLRDEAAVFQQRDVFVPPDHQQRILNLATSLGIQ